MGQHITVRISDELSTRLSRDPVWQANRSAVVRDALRLWAELDNPNEVLAVADQTAEHETESPA